MDNVKHLFRQISGGDYLLILLVGAGIYLLSSKMEQRQRLQLTFFVVLMVFIFRLVAGVSFISLIGGLINRIHFIYIWAPLSLTIFIASMLYEKGNLGTIIVRSLIASICICASLYFVFR